MRKFSFAAAVIAAILSGCASSYRTINPETISYVKDNGSDVSFEYHHNILVESRNKKYHKKEIKKSLQLVALKITNNSENDLEYNKNYQLYSGDAVLNVLSNQAVYSQLKQQAGLHLLYLLLSPMQLYTGSSSGTYSSSNNSISSSSETNSFPIGLIIGPGIALGNMLVASSANTKFKAELDQHCIVNKVIKKGESAFIIVGLNGTSFQPISLKMIKKQTLVEK